MLWYGTNMRRLHALSQLTTLCTIWNLCETKRATEYFLPSHRLDPVCKSYSVSDCISWTWSTPPAALTSAIQTFPRTRGRPAWVPVPIAADCCARDWIRCLVVWCTSMRVGLLSAGLSDEVTCGTGGASAVAASGALLSYSSAQTCCN